MNELVEIRPQLRTLLDGKGGSLRVEIGARWVEVEVWRDGVSAWLLRLTGERKQLYFDCGGRGVAGLNEVSLANLIARCFRQADRRVPS